MTQQFKNDFVVDTSANTISITREFNAGRNLVWRAYTESDLIDQWWAPKPWKAKTKSMDFVEGGRWQYAMVGPEGETHWALAVYTKIIPQELYAGTDAFADENGNINTELPQSSWEVRFSDAGSNTMVEYKIQFPSLEQLEATIAMGFKEGILMAMDGLDLLLETLV